MLGKEDRNCGEKPRDSAVDMPLIAMESEIVSENDIMTFAYGGKLLPFPSSTGTPVKPSPLAYR